MSWGTANGDPATCVPYDKWKTILKATVQDLRRRRISYYVFGGAAFSLQMRPIRTRDLDIALLKFPAAQTWETLLARLEKLLLDSGGEEVVRMMPLTRVGRRLSLTVAFKSGPGLSLELWQYVDEKRPSLFPTEEKTLDGSHVTITTRESWIATKIGQPKNLEDRDVHRLALICERANMQEALRITTRAGLLDNARENLGHRLSSLGIQTPPSLGRLRRMVEARTNKPAAGPAKDQNIKPS